MPSFTKAIRPYVTLEIQLAELHWAAGQRDQAFRHLERAHILGQSSTVQHVRTHWHMFAGGFAANHFGRHLAKLSVWSGLPLIQLLALYLQATRVAQT